MVKPQGRDIIILTNRLSADDHSWYTAGYSLMLEMYYRVGMSDVIGVPIISDDIGIKM